jgi:hypothetical protein
VKYVREVIVVSPRRVEILLNDGKEIVFVIDRNGGFQWAAKTDFIEKSAYQEACQAAGEKFAEIKKLRQQQVAA